MGVAEGRPRGGVLFAVVRGVWGQAGCRGPLPTCCRRGCAGVGALHQPRGPCALWGAARHGGGGGRLGSGAPLLRCLPSGRAAGARWPRAVGAGVRVCGVCGACAVRSLVLGVALRLSLWCPPLSNFVAVLCSSCACRAPFPARFPCSSAGYLPFPSWLRRSLPFPLPSVGSLSHLACRFSLPPPWCVSRSFPLPASLAPVLGPLLSPLLSPVRQREDWGVWAY